MVVIQQEKSIYNYYNIYIYELKMITKWYEVWNELEEWNGFKNWLTMNVGWKLSPNK